MNAGFNLPPMGSGDIAPTEYIRYISEEDAWHLRIDGTEEHLPGFLGDPTTARDNLQSHFSKHWLGISGLTERQGVRYPTSIVVNSPGFIMKTISKIRHREPMATVYITESINPRSADDLANSA
jgi:hypothetical protein